MSGDWSFQEYTRILQNSQWSKQGRSQAIDYKNDFVPSRLYKYFPLLDEYYYGYRKRNKERLISLEEGRLWVSCYNSLNDPFEFNALSLDREKIIEYGFDFEHLKFILGLLKKQIQVSCFSNCGVSNMLLWAHYTNNHKGYCVEYEVTNKDSIIPVTYIPRREKDATIPAKLYSEFLKGYNRNKAPSGEFWKYFNFLYLTLSFKFIHWSYENEFRFFTAEGNVGKGLLIPLASANLNVKKIFIGIHCGHKKELIKIGKNLGCEIHEMIFDDEFLEFSLRSKQLI